TGASMGPTADQSMSEAGIINLRVPYQGNAVMRKKINAGEMYYIDQHLSHTAEEVRKGNLGKIDYAVIEAAAITEEGLIIPTGSVGNLTNLRQKAKHVIIELNTKATKEYEGLQYIYVVGEQNNRREIPLYDVGSRIGEKGIKVDPSKVKGI